MKSVGYMGSYLVAIVCMVICPAGSAVLAVEPPITALAFAPDNESVAVGSQAGLHIFSWPDLKQQRAVKLSMRDIHDLAFSPNGLMLAVGGGVPAEEGITEVVAWPDGESLSVLHGHRDSVLAVVWNGDTSLATTSLDHEIILWDQNTWRPKQTLRGHSKGVTTAQFLSDGQSLISGGLDQNLRVWNIVSGRQVRTLNNHAKEVHAIAVRPHSAPLPMLASVSNDRTVRLWQPTIGRMVRFRKLKSIPLAVAWLPDGSHLVVSCEDGNLRLVDPDTVEIVQEIPAVSGWAYSLAIHPTDGSLLVGGRGGQLKRLLPGVR